MVVTPVSCIGIGACANPSNKRHIFCLALTREGLVVVDVQRIEIAGRSTLFCDMNGRFGIAGAHKLQVDLR